MNCWQMFESFDRTILWQVPSLNMMVIFFVVFLSMEVVTEPVFTKTQCVI